ncbi:MAG: hypothetical protein L0099_10280, partial [Acidobacteria bacterium]|nr:hypothetical protein [Acidobacteriota bacterium]
MRQQLLIFLALLAGGAVLNIPVTWACAIATNPYRPPVTRFIDTTSRLEVLAQRSFGATTFWTTQRHIASFTPPPPPDHNLPKWARGPTPSHFSSAHIFEARGWPCRAFWCVHQFSSPAPPKVFGAISTALAPQPTIGVYATVPRVLPYRPLWPG